MRRHLPQNAASERRGSTLHAQWRGTLRRTDRLSQHLGPFRTGADNQTPLGIGVDYETKETLCRLLVGFMEHVCLDGIQKFLLRQPVVSSPHGHEAVEAHPATDIHAQAGRPPFRVTTEARHRPGNPLSTTLG